MIWGYHYFWKHPYVFIFIPILGERINFDKNSFQVAVFKLWSFCWVWGHGESPHFLLRILLCRPPSALSFSLVSLSPSALPLPPSSRPPPRQPPPWRGSWHLFRGVIGQIRHLSQFQDDPPKDRMPVALDQRLLRGRLLLRPVRYPPLVPDVFPK